MLFFKTPKLNHEKLRARSFKDEFNTYLKLKEIFKDQKLKKDRIVLFNPGAGGDVINPLLFVDALTECRQLDMFFVDDRFYYQFILQGLEEVIDDFKYDISVSAGKAVIKFRLNKTKVNLVYLGEDVFKNLPKDIENGFDVYFERAFRLFREDQIRQMSYIFGRLRKGGFVISDWGFNKNITEKHSLAKMGNLPRNFGIYKNLTIYRKI